MDRFVWLRADARTGSLDERLERIGLAAEVGIDGVVVDAPDVTRVREVFGGTVAAFRTGGDGTVLEVAEAEGPPGDVVVVGKGGEGDGTVARPDTPAESGDIAVIEGTDTPTAAYVVVDDPGDVDFARWVATAAEYVILDRPTAGLATLEHRITDLGEETAVVAVVESPDAAKTVLESFEVEVDGILLDAADVADIEATVRVVDRLRGDRLTLGWASVQDVESTGVADRVSVDMSSILDADEGLLVGSHARGLVLVHGELAAGPDVETRPFRVNAGAVHSYVLAPGGEVRYLAELAGGDRITVVGSNGRIREAVVGRATIERRPMRRVTLELAPDDSVETLFQHAGTVFVRTRTDGAVPVTELAPGAEIAVLAGDGSHGVGVPRQGEPVVEQ